VNPNIFTAMHARLVFFGLLATLCAALRAATADALLLREDFAYADGPLVEASGQEWRLQRGASQARVHGGRLVLSEPDGGESFLTRVLPISPGLDAAATRAVEASFELSLDWQPFQETERYSGIFFQLVSRDAALRRARLHFRTGKPGFFELGLTSTGVGRVAWTGLNLSFDTRHRLKVRYDLRTGATQLWLAGPDGRFGLPAATSTDSDVIVPGRVGVQTDPTQGPVVIRIANLAVEAVK
jgi:hypothetical protein